MNAAVSLAITTAAIIAVGVASASNVYVDTGTERMLHPADIRPSTDGTGIVHLEIAVRPDGSVSDVGSSDGPLELQKITIQSAMNWRFRPSGSRRVVAATIYFGVAPPASHAQAARGPALPKPPVPPPPPTDLIVESVSRFHLPADIDRRVRAEVSLRTGDRLTQQLQTKTLAQLQKINAALIFSFRYGSDKAHASVEIGLREDLLPEHILQRHESRE